MNQNHESIRTALKELPKELKGTYEKAMNQIASQGQYHASLACRILRALTVSEIKHALAVEEIGDDDNNIGGAGVIDEYLIMAVDAGLVTINDESSIIRLVHFAAREYFENIRNTILPSSDHELARFCIKNLTLDCFAAGPCSNDDELLQRFKISPLFFYAASNWGNHVREAPELVCIESVVAFLSNKAFILAAVQAASVSTHRYLDWSQRYPEEIFPLVYAASFGLTRTVEHLLSQGNTLEEKGSDGQTALLAAAMNGHDETVARLLSLGADQTATDIGGETALSLAAGNGYFKMVEQLVQAGSKVNVFAADGWTPLMAAASKGHEGIVKSLLKSGAVVEMQSSDGNTALSLAAREGHYAVVKLLLDVGAKTSTTTSAGRTALILARARGHQDVVQLLATRNEISTSRDSQSVPTIRRNETFRPPNGSNGENFAENLDSGIALNSAKEFQFVVDERSRFPEMQERRLFRQNYIQLGFIGKGYFGKVYVCRERVTGADHAVKVFQKPLCGNMNQLYELVSKEVQMLCRLRHPNIISLRDVINEDERIFVVLELGLEGDFFSWLVKHQKATEVQARKIFIQLMHAIKYLHNLRIVHRDIKPENLLLMDKDLTVKITDFGLATTHNGDDESIRDCRGTPNYIAPEILNNLHRRYGRPVDIWSLGVVLYETLGGYPPFSEDLCTDENPYTRNQQIRMGRYDFPSCYWASVGAQAMNLIFKMLIVDAGKRYTIDQCLRHPWITLEKTKTTAT